MRAAKDPIEGLKKAAAALPDVVEGLSCNQSSFKAGKKAFLYVGPGTKGVGFKAMFQLDASRAEAEQLAASDPQRFEVGIGGWVTARFSVEAPLPKTVWSRWLAESYARAARGGTRQQALQRKKK